MDGDAEIVGYAGQRSADVALASEPELSTLGEAGSEGLCDEQPAGGVVGGDGRRVIEQRPRVEHLEYLGVRVSDHVEVVAGQGGEEPSELATTGGVHPLQKAPVP